MADYYYRIEDCLVSAGVDEFDNSLGPARVDVVIRRYRVEKYTPKGVWLSYAFGKKFVLHSARKRWACPSLELALESFVARKKKQAAILEARVNRAQQAQRMAVRKVELAMKPEFFGNINNVAY